MILSKGSKKGTTKLYRGCYKCGDVIEIEVFFEDFVKYTSGTYIHQAFPYLSEDERELLISGICGKCFDELFEGGEDDE